MRWPPEKLNAWLPVGRPVREGLGGVALLKEVSNWGEGEAGFEVSNT